MTDGTILSNFHSEKKLAKELGHHPQTLRRWRHQGIGPKFAMNGREIIYHNDDVALWLRAGGVAAANKQQQPRQRKRRRP
jgi:hypothetical protein